MRCQKNSRHLAYQISYWPSTTTIYFVPLPRLSDAFAPLHHTLISKKTNYIIHNFADFSRFEVCIENGGIWKNNPYNHTTTKGLVICQSCKNYHFISTVISRCYRKSKNDEHFIYPFAIVMFAVSGKWDRLRHWEEENC